MADALTDERAILRRIANDRNQDGNNINVADVNLSTVKRTTKTVTTDNAVTIQVLQDPERARKSIETLVNKVAEAVNLVQNDEELKKDVTFRKAASGLRRALNQIGGASNGGLQGSGTSDVVTVDSKKLSTALTDEGTFRRIESALQGRGGAAFQLINTTTGSARGLEVNITGQLREQKTVESQITDLTTEAEQKRKDLLEGLKDVGSAILSSAGTQTQTTSQSQTTQRQIRQPGQNQFANITNSAQQQNNGLLKGLGNLTTATTNVVNNRSFLQNFSAKLGVG